MIAKPKTGKAPAAKTKQKEKRHVCTMAEAAELDWGPGATNLPVELLSIERFNNPHLVTCRVAFILLEKTKPELMAMFDGDHDHLLCDLAERIVSTKDLFDEFSRLLDTIHTRILVAGASVAEAEAA